jgi:hypothetical protein
MAATIDALREHWLGKANSGDIEQRIKSLNLAERRRAGGNTMSFHVPILTGGELRQRAVVTYPATSDSFTTDYTQSDIVTQLAKGQRVVSVCNVMDLSSSPQADIRENARTDTAAATASGSLLPEGSFSVERTYDPAHRCGVWVPCEERTLADAGAIRQTLEVALMDDFWRLVDQLILNGDGTGENPKGILQTSGIGTRAKGTDARFLALLKSVNDVRTASNSTGPIDVVARSADLLAFLSDPSLPAAYKSILADMGVRQFLVSPLVPTAGTMVVGDFASEHVTIRSAAQLGVAASHSSFFVEGKVAVSLEARLSVRTVRPSAFLALSSMG